MTSKNEARDYALFLCKSMEEGVTYEDCGLDAEESGAEPTDIISGFDYLQDALDIIYYTRRNDRGVLEYVGARLLVAYGGPNAWIDTRSETVEVYWGGDSCTLSYSGDVMGVDDACEELFSC